MAFEELTRGFLPKQDPIPILPSIFQPWEDIARTLPKWLMSTTLRNKIKSLPEFPINQLNDKSHYQRAMLILSYLGHAYVWGENPAVDVLPKVLAQPWYQVAKYLERPPVLSYASYALYNWMRLNPQGPIELGNIALLQNFLGGQDEEWFVLVHVDIEAKAEALVKNVLIIVENKIGLGEALQPIVNALNAICEALDRIPERCDPYIYYQRVRPYIHGWLNNPVLPEGLIYEGVEEYQGKPQKFRGETGAQSTIIPMCDALLGIEHKKDMLQKYLQEMRGYMPKNHRMLLEYVEKNTNVREQVLSGDLKLKKIYNDCIDLLARFRKTHLSYAIEYIHKQSQASDANPTGVGTGGTPFIEYLRKHVEETIEFKIL
ncbi:MAG: hypothetical protein ACE365_01730 [Gammaproteobacteria bacterium]